MLLYIGCHSASPPSPIGSWSPYQLLPRLPLSLSLLPRDSVFSGGQWHSSEWAPVVPPSARMAVDCVIESESGGACRELEVEAPTRGSLWVGGSRKSRDKHWEEQNKNGEKMQMYRSEENEWHKQRENKQRERRSWGEKGGKERQRMSKSGMEKKCDHPFWKLERGGCSCGGRLGLWSMEDVLKQHCLEFILSCHAVSDPLSGISFCKD